MQTYFITVTVISYHIISYLRLFNFVKTQSSIINKVSGVNSKTIDMITIVEKQLIHVFVNHTNDKIRLSEMTSFVYK